MRTHIRELKGWEVERAVLGTLSFTKYLMWKDLEERSDALGTGKSQTITKMIVQCLAEKKTVLFVAQKTAALKVVMRRLEEIGLEDHALVMRSGSATGRNRLAVQRSAGNRSPPSHFDPQKVSERFWSRFAEL